MSKLRAILWDKTDRDLGYKLSEILGDEFRGYLSYKLITTLNTYSQPKPIIGEQLVELRHAELTKGTID